MKPTIVPTDLRPVGHDECEERAAAELLVADPPDLEQAIASLLVASRPAPEGSLLDASRPTPEESDEVST